MHFAVLFEPHHFHTQKWVKGLLACGQKVTVFSFSEGEIPGANCVKIPPKFGRNGKPSYLSFLHSGPALSRELQKHNIDILNPINVTPYGVWARKSGFSPMVSIAMGADILEYAPAHVDFYIPNNRRWEVNGFKGASFLTKGMRTLRRNFFRQEVNKTLLASDFITGDNLLLVHAIRDWFHIPEEKLMLNRWGVEEELFDITPEQKQQLQEKYGILANQRVILSPRGMKPLYQGDIICEAFEALLKQGYKEKFIMLSAGYGVPDELDRKARSLAESYPNFYYEAGRIPREEACLLWNLADVFISAPVYDGYSNALSEGRYMGVVPVVNDIPATQELIRHKENAWVVHPFDSATLAGELQDILAELPKWKDKFAQENRSWILENAHLKSNMEAFVEACEKLL